MLYATVLGSERQNNKKKIIVERHTAVCVYLIEVVALALLFNSTFFAAKLQGNSFLINFFGLCENLFLISFIFCLSDKAIEKA